MNIRHPSAPLPANCCTFGIFRALVLALFFAPSEYADEEMYFVSYIVLCRICRESIFAAIFGVTRTEKCERNDACCSSHSRSITFWMFVDLRGLFYNTDGVAEMKYRCWKIASRSVKLDDEYKISRFQRFFFFFFFYTSQNNNSRASEMETEAPER